jgi:hypothetical protein
VYIYASFLGALLCKNQLYFFSKLCSTIFQLTWAYVYIYMYVHMCSSIANEFEPWSISPDPTGSKKRRFLFLLLRSDLLKSQVPVFPFSYAIKQEKNRPNACASTPEPEPVPLIQLPVSDICVSVSFVCVFVLSVPTYRSLSDLRYYRFMHHST